MTIKGLNFGSLGDDDEGDAVDEYDKTSPGAIDDDSENEMLEIDEGADEQPEFELSESTHMDRRVAMSVISGITTSVMDKI